MLPLRQMPSEDRGALRAIYRKRYRHGLIVCADARRAEYRIDPDFPPEWGCLSVVWIRNGREEYHFPYQDRALVVDDDTYLVLGACSRYDYRLRSAGTARCLMVSFPPSMTTTATSPLANELEAPPGLDESSELLTEHLAGHDPVVTPELRRIESACVDGVADPEWYRQQMAVLLQQLRIAHDPDAPGLRSLRRTTRRELARRVALATDCIHEDYRRPLGLDALARAAELSPFHLLRVFKAVHGVTPQEFLQRKRVAVANRLLATTRLSATRVAALVGFKSRSSLYRWMSRVNTQRGRTPLPPRV